MTMASDRIVARDGGVGAAPSSLKTDDQTSPGTAAMPTNAPQASEQPTLSKSVLYPY